MLCASWLTDLYKHRSLGLAGYQICKSCSTAVPHLETFNNNLTVKKIKYLEASMDTLGRLPPAVAIWFPIDLAVSAFSTLMSSVLSSPATLH